jgi:hypothetical protein
MKFATLTSLALLAFRVVAAPAPSAEPEFDKLVNDIKNIQLEALKTENAALVKRGVNPTCNVKNVAFRRE